MPRESYADQLEELREEIVLMGELVLERYDSALSARLDCDSELATTVVEGDREINEWYLDIERECIELFALQQPVATDLRFVASSFKIATDLERIGDLATNLAGDPDDPSPPSGTAVDTESIGTEARDMVAAALEAYAVEDTEACWSIAERDDRLDATCESAARDIVANLASADPAGDADALHEEASALLLVLRDLERVGDHAVNIAARTLYMVDHDDSLLF